MGLVAGEDGGSSPLAAGHDRVELVEQIVGGDVFRRCLNPLNCGCGDQVLEAWGCLAWLMESTHRFNDRHEFALK